MNRDFAHTITLLRKEKKLSQKDAASELGISQALLSHYEKGIRECSLSFVVKAADFYGVTCDYLLGRTDDRQYDISELSVEAAAPTRQDTAGIINRRLLDNTAGIIYDSLAKVGSRKLTRTVTGYLMLGYYKLFRLLYHANPANTGDMFTIPKHLYRGYSTAAQEKLFTDIETMCRPDSGSNVQGLTEQSITPEYLAEEFPEAAGSLFNVIRHAESSINKIK